MTKEARKGMEWAVQEVRTGLKNGWTADEVLIEIGVTSLEDTTFFLAYVQQEHPKLYKSIV